MRLGMKRRPSLIGILAPALLLMAVLAFPGDAYAAIAHVDGYLSANGNCLMLRQHDGATMTLVGGINGLLNGDHVRLEGTFVGDPGCGAVGFNVGLVQTLWADDSHQSVYFDHLNGEPFVRYAERSGRIGEPIAYDREHPRDQREQYGHRERDNHERYDRNGHYLYQGPHRKVTLVGRLQQTGNSCPTLRTSYTTFALDGDLRDYQAGDAVKVNGVLFDDDPNAPCGAPTVVIRSIRGH
ncbi:MAG TPA: hypothetical protein VHR45_01035 [Thermoanaerobaculia bacterium]|nr:hypothetical protein [Thermoanaerobaculia bacterium]